MDTLSTLRRLTIGLAVAPAVAALAFAGFNAADAGSPGTVRTGGATLTLRSAATTGSQALAHIPHGTRLDLQCRTTGQRVAGNTTWDRVTHNGRTGYVSAAYVSGGTAASLPDCNGTSATVRTGGATLLLRSSASTNAAVVASIPNGTRLKVTCQAQGTSISGTQGTTSRWLKVNYGNRTGFVSGAFVAGATNAPACSGTAPRPKPAPGSLDNPHGPSWGPNGGWTPRAAWLRDQIKARFGSDCTTYRSGSGEHATGNGLDCWGSTETRRQISRWAAANAGPLEVYYVIHEQKIWGIYNPVWKQMEDRGSITQNHFDHVHISMQTPSREY